MHLAFEVWPRCYIVHCRAASSMCIVSRVRLTLFTHPIKRFCTFSQTCSQTWQPHPLYPSFCQLLCHAFFASRKKFTNNKDALGLMHRYFTSWPIVKRTADRECPAWKCASFAWQPVLCGTHCSKDSDFSFAELRDGGSNQVTLPPLYSTSAIWHAHGAGHCVASTCSVCS